MLSYYQLSAASFADSIGVQRSSISHLLSGRNKPSLEFVLKVVKTFPEVNLYWLLNGKGSFPPPASARPTESKHQPLPQSSELNRMIDKIIIFYTDGSFETYNKNLDPN